MAFLRQLPASIIFSVLTLTSSNAMAPPASIESVPTLMDLNPNCGPEILRTSYRALVISVMWMFGQLPLE